MADNWNDNAWAIAGGSGPGPQPGGSTIYRALRPFVSQVLETRLHTRDLDGATRGKVEKMLVTGHSLTLDGERFIANMLLYHVNDTIWPFHIWHVRPNEFTAWAGKHAPALRDNVKASLQMMDVQDPYVRLDEYEGTVSAKLHGTAQRMQVQTPWGGTRSKKVPRVNTDLKHVRGLLLQAIEQCDEYEVVRRKALRALRDGVEIVKIQTFAGEKRS